MVEIAVVLACGVGAVSRYLVDAAVTRRSRGRFPLGTFVVNVSGSLFLGLVAGLLARQGLSPDLAVVLAVGFSGGYTTLSTWSWETLVLVEDSAWRPALVNIAGSIAVGLSVAAAGYAVTML
ncbi:MAG TPA: fluoride efflux transporter CrcB [Mycobacteriales bacterium]|nr:fluoride efflux transporter CrcB [Mycobacteriales bacterium]